VRVEALSRSESHLCDDRPLDRVCDNKISNSNLCHDAKAVDSLNSELLPSSSSIAGCALKNNLLVRSKLKELVLVRSHP
jgi:hypothetical protein